MATVSLPPQNHAIFETFSNSTVCRLRQFSDSLFACIIFQLYSNDSTSSVMTTPTTPVRREQNVFSSLKRQQTPGSTSRERAENVLVDKVISFSSIS
jgi:hypothetical protein